MEDNARRSAIGRPVGRTTHTASPRPLGLRWRRVVIAAIVLGVPVGAVAFSASNAHTVTTAFDFTGEPAPYVVPANVCRVRIEAIGASGGGGTTAGAPGAGA